MPGVELGVLVIPAVVELGVFVALVPSVLLEDEEDVPRENVCAATLSCEVKSNPFSPLSSAPPDDNNCAWHPKGKFDSVGNSV
jgi:hypothetical protein